MSSMPKATTESTSSRKKPTARQEYIRFLEIASEPSEEVLIAELIESKHLKGLVRPSPDGTVSAAMFNGITMEGRLLLQRLKKEEAEESIIGRTKRYGIFLVGVVGGLLIDVLKDVVLKLIETNG